MKNNQHNSTTNPANLHNLMANLPGVIYQYILHSDGTEELSYISPGCQIIYELNDLEMQQNSDLMWGFSHFQERKQFQESVLDAAKNLIPWKQEWQQITASGNVKWLLTTAQPQLQNNGDIFLEGFIVDITQRKATEVATLQLKQDLENSQRIAHLGNREFNVATQTMNCSEELYRILGLDPQKEPPSFSQLYDIIHPDDQERWLNNVEQALAEGKSYEIDHRIIRADGQIRYLNGRGQAIRNEAGQVLRLFETTIDITDRKQGEEILREKEQFLRSIYDGVEQIIFVVDVSPDQEFHCLGWNPAAERMTEMKSSEVYGKIPEEIYGEIQGKIIRQHYQNCIHAGTSIRYEESVTFLNNQVFILTTLNPLKDELGKIYRLIGTSIDITERKVAEMALQQSQMRFQRLVENVPGVTYQYHQLGDSLKGTFTYLSPNCLELTEIEPATIMQNSSLMWGLIHPDDVSAFVDSMATAVATKQPWLHEYRLVTPSGKLKWVQGGGSLERQGDGNIIWDGLLIDISNHKKSEEALRRSEAQLRELVEREALQNCITNLIRDSLDLNIILETTVQEIRKLLTIDRCYFVWYQKSWEHPEWEVVKEAKIDSLASVTELYPGDALRPLTELLLKGEKICLDEISRCQAPVIQNFFLILGFNSVLVWPIQTQAGKVGALVLAHCNNTRPWVEAEIEMLQTVVNQLAIAINQAELYTESRELVRLSQGKTQELEMTLNQLKNAQTQLVQSEKMSSLGQMVGGIAHEINNPVSFIFGNITYAEEYIENLLALLALYQQHLPEASPDIEDFIEEIDLTFLKEDFPRLLNSMKVGTQRIQTIVQSLRTFSRLDEAEMKDVDIHENLDSTLLILQSRFKEQPNSPAIQVIKQYAELPKVECYPGELNQVFMNLLTNAIDALEERNKQRSLEDNYADPPLIWISTLLTDNDSIQIRIADNGTGIKSEVLPKIFDPFYTTKPIGSATGLGLSTSYQIIVEKHRGQLNCVSQEGLGTEFLIEIPLRQTGIHN